MATAWIERRRTKHGGARFRVRYRLSPEGKKRYGGSFKTRREALSRRTVLVGELAALRVPNLALLGPEESSSAPTFAEASKHWLDSRINVSASTVIQNRTSVGRALPVLGARPVDQIAAQDIADMVVEVHHDRVKVGYLRKVLQAVAMTFDHAGIEPNPARDRRVVMPYAEEEEVAPPTAAHVAAVFHLLPSKHRLALLWLDWSGARVSSIDHVLVGDYDEPRHRVRLRARTTKTRKALWIELHPTLAEAVESSLGPREDRDPAARLFADSGADALRTSIAKACKAAAVPLFSPHDLRHRRISLLHLRGMPWARIGEFVGQRNLAVTANTYSHVMLDETELEYAELLAGARA